MRTVVRKARPNGHLICLVMYGVMEDATWVVTTPDDEDGCEFDGEREKAYEYFLKTVEEYSTIPNWEAQARYDEEHGTINGYSPWQFNREY